MNVQTATDQLVQAAIADLLGNIRTQISEKIYYEITAALSGFDIHQELLNRINETVNQAVTTYHWPDNNFGQDAVVTGITTEFKNRTTEYLVALSAHVQQKIIEDLYHKLQTLDYTTYIREQIDTVIRASISTYNFPNQSIPGSSIRTDTLKITTGMIEPGTFQRFESTGIQDSATRCQLTILDEATVFENRLVSQDIEIAGSATFNGTLNFNGSIDTNSKFIQQIVDSSVEKITNNYTDGTYDQYSNRVIDRLNQQGLSAESVRVGDKPIVQGETLAGTITQSNLQRVGALSELQVVGETLLDETVYVSNRRMGINTLEPERALDLWDQEIQVTVGKKQQNQAQINTPRNQQLIIGTGSKDQLVLNTDGSITVQQLDIGKLRHSSASSAPTDNRPVGTVVWNERPQIGASIGWVSLGGARWARFGTISE